MEQHKVVGSLPTTLNPDSIYYVKIEGVNEFDVYVTDSDSVAHKLRQPTTEQKDTVLIWAEEAGSKEFQKDLWSFGSGNTGFIGLPIVEKWDVYAISFNAEKFGEKSGIILELYDVVTNNTLEEIKVSENNSIVKFDDLVLAEGQTLGIRTLDKNSVFNARLCIWLKR